MHRCSIHNRSFLAALVCTAGLLVFCPLSYADGELNSDKEALRQMEGAPNGPVIIETRPDQGKERLKAHVPGAEIPDGSSEGSTKVWDTSGPVPVSPHIPHVPGGSGMYGGTVVGIPGNVIIDAREHEHRRPR